MSARSLLAIAALVIGGSLVWLWLSKESAPVRAYTASKGKPALKVPSNLDWSLVPEGELREYLTYFDDAPPGAGAKEREIGKEPTPVAEGETVVTHAYEADPGSFVFSTVTPTRTKLKDGKDGAHLAIKTFKVGVSGSYELLSTSTSDIPLNGAFSSMILAPGRNYEMALKVSSGEGDSLLLQSFGGQMSKNDLGPEMFKKKP